MRLTSIRARVALLSTLFALLLVGGVTFATYFFVATGMRSSAEATSDRLAGAAERVFSRYQAQAVTDAHTAGLTGAAADDFIREQVLRVVPEVISQGLVYEGSFALSMATTSAAELDVVWTVGDYARAGASESRQAAVDLDSQTREYPSLPPLFLGLFAPADLGLYVVHLPLDLAGTRSAVLDVVYDPAREEAILDSTRLPMVAVTVVAFATSLLITNLIMSWALSLIASIKRTADSIDVGRLDVHLPEEGDNEVTELARSLNRLIDNLRYRNEAQSRFIADASHELATPVAGIRGYVNILRAWGAEDPGLREEAVSAIDRESRRMARLCSDLLSVIRSEEMVEFRSMRYDINAVSREVLANAATRYIDKHLDFEGPSEGPLWLHGDPDRVEEALGILVDNACKYTPDGGSVSVTTRRRRDVILIEVVDTGVGIPEQDLPNVFERFYRSDLSRSKETGGFGLGLAIAKHIIDTSGGDIAVKSTIGRGTTFTISLPRQRGKREAGE